MAKTNRWTIDAIRAARSKLSARIRQLSSMSDSQVLDEASNWVTVLSTRVTVEALRRFLIDDAIEAILPDSPPTPPTQPRQEEP